MIGAVRRGVAAVVGGQNQQVIVTELRQQCAELRVKGVQCLRIACNIAAVAVCVVCAVIAAMRFVKRPRETGLPGEGEAEVERLSDGKVKLKLIFPNYYMTLSNVTWEQLDVIFSEDF